MAAKLLPFQKTDAEFFEDVVVIVEADDFAQHALWSMYHRNPAYGAKVETWKEVPAGKMVTVGKLDKRPVAIVLNWAILNGKKVLFWFASSQVVDHKMIDTWFDHFAKNKGARIASCDAQNFHQVLDVVGRTSVVEGPYRVSALVTGPGVT